MKRALAGFFVGLASVLSLPAHAESKNENIIYAGAGKSIKEESPCRSGKTPFSIGYIRASKSSVMTWGFDVSQEGTKLDSTWGQTEEVTQGTSFNLLVGGKVMGSQNTRVDALILVGARQTTASCPDSYLGYRCYADADPNNTYAINYGGVLSVSFNRLMLGARVTGESAQGLIGLRF